MKKNPIQLEWNFAHSEHVGGFVCTCPVLLKLKIFMSFAKFLVAFSILILVGTFALAQDETHSPRTTGGNSDGETEIPESACFKMSDLESGECKMVGRLSITRKFLGTRAETQVKDVVQFHFLDGDELRFLRFEDGELESRFVGQLGNGQCVPVLIKGKITKTRVGHDGINMSTRLVARIEECEQVAMEALYASAIAKGFEEADVKRFESTFEPDAASSNGIAVSIGRVFVRSKTARNGSGLSINGIRVFNTHSEDVAVKVTRMWSKQGEAIQDYELAERSRGPKSWVVAAGSWSDGVYEEGQMPRVLWTFTPAQPIESDTPLTLHLELQLNGEAVTITKTVEPK
jgi:hypothetical protein